MSDFTEVLINCYTGLIFLKLHADHRYTYTSYNVSWRMIKNLQHSFILVVFWAISQAERNTYNPSTY